MTRKGRIVLSIILALVLLSSALAAVLLKQAMETAELEELRNSVLEELERNIGTYDEQSIVLNQTSKANAGELATLLGAKLRITEDGRFATLTLPEGTTIRDVYADDANLEHLEKMAVDYQVRISDLEAEEGTAERLPTRPQYSVSDSDYELQTYLDYLNMQDVWNYYTGSGVTVAVIDTGIDTDHPEFAGRISEYSYNATEDKIVKDWTDENGNYDWSLIEDKVGHGTAVAGVIAASMNSGNVVGIAPYAEILVIKAECDENGTFYRTSDLVFGLYYAIERDVQAVNMSFGTYSPVNPFAAAAQLAVDSDILCVAAAGNDGTSSLCWPAADPNVIGVGALAADSWELADYSNYGENVNLVAPGTTYTAKMGGGYGTTNGTSFASPTVAGAIALFMQTDPYIMVEDVKEVLYASSCDLGDFGRDWTYGFGALDMNAFLLEERGTITFDMLTDELENTEGLFIKGHTLQELPEPERLYAVFDGWYYDDTFTQEYVYYEDKFYDNITLYAKWVNEDDGVPYTYVELEDGTIEIRSYTGRRRYITIPEKINGKVVSSIGDFAFAGQTRLREVDLPSGLTAIKRYAFEGCSNLISIYIPEKVVSIGEFAFAENTRLSTVAFTGNSNLKTVGSFAFSHCGNLKSIELPAGLESIDATAFYGDISLCEIKVQAGNANFVSEDGVLYNTTRSLLLAYPAAHGEGYTIHENAMAIANYAFAYARLTAVELGDVETIGEYCFEGSLLKKAVIPDTVTSMGKGAFASCRDLASVTLGDRLTAVAPCCFNTCTALKQIHIPAGIAYVGAGAFAQSGLETITFWENSTLSKIDEYAFLCSALKEIEFPDSLAEIGLSAFSKTPLAKISSGENSSLRIIGGSAFAGCALLEEAVLPGHLETIGDLAFAETALKEVTVPGSVTFLGNGVFAFCGNLTAVSVEEGNTVYHDLDGVVYNLSDSVIHTYPAGREEWAYTIQPTVTQVAAYAFAGTHKLGTAILPQGLTVLGANSFYASGIDYITLPDSLAEIREYAFASCTDLTGIHIPDGVLQVGRYAFAEDWNLSSVTFGEDAKLPRISYGAFAYTGLQQFTVPASVSTIAQGAFEGSGNLTSITFAANSKLESISAYMFDGCSNLQSITFLPGSKLTSIQAHGLEGMDNLTSVDFGDAKLENVDNFAFRFCESLSSLSLPDSVKSVGRYAFYGCKSLSSLSLPEGLEHIGSYAFLGTNDLDLYMAAETMPAYLDENWDCGIRGYYTGVTNVETSGDYKYAALTSGNTAIIEYLGTDKTVDLTTVNLGAPIVTIGGSSFKDSTVERIILPDTLISIQAEAFQYSPLKSVVIPACVTFIGREAFAYTDIETLTFAENSALNTIEQYAFGNTDSLSSVTIPASVTTLGTGVFQKSGLASVTFAKGIALEEIPQNAFMGTKLTTVTLPDSVKTVNHNAFRDILTLKTVSFGNSDGIRLLSNVFYNTGLESLHIPASVTYIGEYCFVGLEKLATITVDENNPNYKSVDGLLLTKSGRKLVAVPAGRTGSLTVPISVEEIGFGAFENTALERILFDPNANILSLGYRAFFGAKNLTSIHIPASVVSIDYYAFAYCEKLHTVTFAESNQLKGIYEGAFCGDINLENITIPDAIVEISDFAFYGCAKITKLPISDTHNLKGIYDYAFAYTSIDGEFTTPETLIDIGAYTFMGTHITKLTIPDTNKKDLIIGIGAFEDCNKLAEVTLPFIGASYEDEELSWFGYIFGAGAYEANQTYVPESLKTVTITEGITFVGVGGFFNLGLVEEIFVPHSVSMVGQYAFWSTVAKFELSNTITPIYIDSGRIYASDYFNMGGIGLSGALKISDGVTHVRISYSFANKLDLPNGVTIVEVNDCKELTELNLPDGVQRVIAGGSGIKHIVLPRSIESFDFAGSSLESVILPSNLKQIPSWSFASCPLKSIEIPETVTEIGDNAFWCCASLLEVNIPTGVRNLTSTFYGCSALSEIVIPEGITSIGEAAFARCNGLKTVHLPSTLQYIGTVAFGECYHLTEIYNNSNLGLTLGEPSTHGGIAEYAKLIVDKDGKKTYRDDISDLLTIDTAEGFRFVKENGIYTLVGYFGTEETITLPLDIDGNEYNIYRFTGGKHIIIPEGHNKISVDAFYANRTIQSVVMPDTITEIGSGAFSYCENLESISFSKALKRIENSSFQFTKLQEVVIPEGVTSIGSNAFNDNSCLESVILPESLEIIESGAFSGTSLKEVYIPKNVREIFNTAFDNCKLVLSPGNRNFTVIEDVVYNKDVTQIVFVPDHVVEIVVPATINSLENAFANNRNIRRIYFEPNSALKEIGYGAFIWCENLEYVELPEGITEIGDSAFGYCSKLKNMVIPESVQRIGSSAFENCHSLITLHIPKNVTALYYNSITQCQGLELITVDPCNPNYCTVDGVVYTKDLTSIIAVPGNLQGYITVPEGITEIPYFAFANCISLQGVTLPNGLKYIDSVAFSGCTALEYVYMPDTVEAMGYSVFSGCHALTSIRLSENLTTLPTHTFSNCRNLATVKLPEKITTIEDYAFLDSGIVDITLPRQITEIVGRTFASCYELSRITLPHSLERISGDAFDGCNSLIEIVNNSDIDIRLGDRENGAIGLNAKVLIDKDGNRSFVEGHSETDVFITEDEFLFIQQNGEYILRAYVGDNLVVELPNDCKGQKYKIYHFLGASYVEIPEGRTVIDYNAFDGAAIKRVSLPSTVQIIEDYAFSACTHLADINLPKSLTHIGTYAFAWCGFTEITIPENVTHIGSSAFCNNRNLVQIEFLPQNVHEIGMWFISDTPYYNNPDNWKDGCLCLGNYLIAVDKEAEKISIPEHVTGIANGAFDGCYSLKELYVHKLTNNLCGFTNLETLIVGNVTGPIFEAMSWSVPFTLKNIVLEDVVSSHNISSSLFENITGVTIYVEALEQDLRWDDNFPGWSNGNKVVYGDSWSWVTFYDGEGNIISREPKLNSEIIRLPVYEVQGDEQFSYVVKGWDLDGDGTADYIPATTAVDLEIRPIVEKVQRLYTVTFGDLNGTVYHTATLPYGGTVVLPRDPEKRGHDFLGWSNYAEGMTATGDMTIYASWRHHGDGHVYGDAVWVEPTCEEKGFYKHTCTLCGEFYGTGYVEATGHSYTETTVAPTCVEEGYVLRTCTLCGGTEKTDLTPATGHSFGDWVVGVPASCKEAGRRYRSCGVCGVREDAVVPATGHSYVGTVEQEATCDREGVMLYTCEECGDRVEERIATKPHNYVKKYVSKSWLRILIERLLDLLFGYEGDQAYYFVCADCGRMRRVDEVQGNGTGVQSVSCAHMLSEWELYLPGEQGENGVEARYCQLCNKPVEFRTAEPCKEHSGEWTIVKEAACATDGLKQEICVHCGTVLNTETIPALGHAFGEWYEVAPGREERACTSCGETESREKAVNYDVDGDGTVTEGDAQMLLSVLVGNTATDTLFDFDFDGVLTIYDCVLLMQQIG